MNSDFSGEWKATIQTAAPLTKGDLLGAVTKNGMQTKVDFNKVKLIPTDPTGKALSGATDATPSQNWKLEAQFANQAAYEAGNRNMWLFGIPTSPNEAGVYAQVIPNFVFKEVKNNEKSMTATEQDGKLYIDENGLADICNCLRSCGKNRLYWRFLCFLPLD